MDPLRQLRFLVPPFFLVASLLVGAHLGGVLDLSILKSEAIAKNITGIIALVIAIATATVLPLGFLITTISVNLLRLIARISYRFNPRYYEAVLSDESWDRIWKKLG